MCFYHAADGGLGVGGEAGGKEVAFLEVFDELGGSVGELDKGVTGETATTATVVLVIVVVVVDLSKLLGVFRDLNHLSLFLLLNFVCSGGLRWVHIVINIICTVGYIIEEITAETIETWVSKVVFDLDVKRADKLAVLVCTPLFHVFVFTQ